MSISYKISEEKLVLVNILLLCKLNKMIIYIIKIFVYLLYKNK